MALNVGVIGTGMMGTVHIENLANRIAGTAVTAVFDVDTDRAAEIASQVGASATGSAAELVRRHDVDALLIATPGFTHAEIVLDALTVGKPMLCEKPLATSAEDALRIVEAEAALGKRLIQLGFMRRFDPGYLEVKGAIESGNIGEPLMAHMFHRNAVPPPGFNDELAMNDSFAHEVDITRWLFDNEIVATRVLQGKSSPAVPADAHDPQVLVLELADGALVLAEAYLANGFGYDVRCEVVGSSGTAELSTPRLSRLTGVGSISEIISPSWRERFGDTYRIEVQAWVDSLQSGTIVGANAWDGYAVAAVAEASVAAIGEHGGRVPVTMVDRPALYN